MAASPASPLTDTGWPSPLASTRSQRKEKMGKKIQKFKKILTK